MSKKVPVSEMSFPSSVLAISQYVGAQL